MPTAPPGGFQQGGWYDGRQYWNGSFSEPGQIHTQSDQRGAGQLVSKEVVQQTAPQNWDFLQQQRQQAQLPASSPATQARPSGPSTATGPGVTMPQQQDFNLPEMYKGLYQESGISERETELAGYEREFTEAKARIDDNPFLSEATRVGKQAKLQKLFDDRTANIRGEIATKKADIETKLNLEMKQFDINSAQVDRAWDQFNTLLSAGALDGASGESIAQITRSTGISSDMIYSAIDANKKKNIKTQMYKDVADSGEVTVTTMNANTGEIISQKSLGFVGNQQGTSGGGGGGSIPSATELKKSATEAARQGKTYQDMLAFFRSYGLSPKEIYQIYTTVNYYGRPPEGVSSTTGEYFN